MSFSRLIVPAKVEDLNDPRSLPDWRDRSFYPKPGTLTPAQWRWEFLRRDASYQAAWIRCMIDPHRDTIKNESRQFYLTRLIEPRLSAQQVPVQDVRFNRHLMRAGPELFASGIAVPYVSTPTGRIPLPLYRREMKDFLAEANGSGDLLVRIRPNCALKPQLDAIRKRVAALTKEKPRNTRHRVRNYSLYLRLLDARSGKSPASWNEIAKLLVRERSGMSKDGVRSLYNQAVGRQSQMIRSPQTT